MKTSRDERDDITCPYCGHNTDAATDVEGEATPGPGDWSVCFYCAMPSIFTGDGLITRAITPEEARAALDETALVAARGVLLAYLGTGGGPHD